MEQMHLLFLPELLVISLNISNPAIRYSNNWVFCHMPEVRFLHVTDPYHRYDPSTLRSITFWQDDTPNLTKIEIFKFFSFCHIMQQFLPVILLLDHQLFQKISLHLLIGSYLKEQLEQLCIQCCKIHSSGGTHH